MGAGDVAEPVAVDVVFERFPASVRGAVIVRGADADPHQIALRAADVVELTAPSRPVRPVAIDPVTVDIAPRSEVLIPFDIAFGGLEPGWYAVVAEVQVDGQQRVRGPDPREGRRFLVTWPGGTMRRGTVEVGRPIPESGGAEVDRLECKTDRLVVRWRHAPGEEPAFGDLRVLADGRALPTLESSYRPDAGERTTVVYPVPKAQERLTLELDRRRGPDGATERGTWSLEVKLG